MMKIADLLPPAPATRGELIDLLDEANVAFDRMIDNFAEAGAVVRKIRALLVDDEPAGEFAEPAEDQSVERSPSRDGAESD
jgi:hypothetical protein